MKDELPPIFVGGTGRSGTSIMEQFLNSHSSLVTPVYENKLIVEEGGIKSLVENLSTGCEYKGNHYAISNFIKWADTLRKSGFQNKIASFVYRGPTSPLTFSQRKEYPLRKFVGFYPFLTFRSSISDKVSVFLITTVALISFLPT